MSVQRPLSPFMIGPYYRPQLTSMLSILHRITGLFLCLGAVVMIAWACALAAGPEAYASYAALAHSLPGQVVAAGSVFALCYHLANGIRHLVWDAGKAFDLKSAYLGGYLVIAFSLLATALVLARLKGAL
jgi:succinate dehydrogenase / fumarate reductase cytochrome b subunit